ncbi:competence/damage-inducible protein A [Aureimonas glaciei]|jgi:molybdenum cofactor synthesis domain-containing protein|uniref:Molybdenum cofactor biosynthesis protein n=1 Tax=Aureimonas glaciei TaxID=1776957 RepID=A0A916XYW0_9HYPH|nr:competence/damage-inducible protein A [Aureimonas glaciei]GGD22294.1 molybdenum cofactor biosynthesis protein [Aureimonas glaciei]
MQLPSTPTTAAMLAIGDEILSGRTKDKNIGHLADVLTMAGIDLKEVRIIGDDPHLIADTLNTLRRNYDFVFTSGGIGPTHDDVTAEAVAAAFSLPLIEHPEAVARLTAYYEGRNLPFTEARRRMTRTPEGASLVDNPVSMAPGFRVDNVFVFAGVPAVFEAMLGNALSQLPAGQAIASVSVECPFGEGDIGDPLAAIQKLHPGVAIGSYPRFDGQRYSTQIVLRSRDAEKLATATAAVEALMAVMSGR